MQPFKTQLRGNDTTRWTPRSRQQRRLSALPEQAAAEHSEHLGFTQQRCEELGGAL